MAYLDYNGLAYFKGKLDSEISATLIVDSTSGTIASFPDGADGMPIKMLTAEIDLVQAGTGDPSPSNVRPITGWTGCNIYRTETGTSNPITFAISWQATAGTVYHGSITLNEDGSADLTVDYASVTLTGSSDEDWRTYSTHGFVITISDMKSGTAMDGWCDTFPLAPAGTFGIRIGGGNKNIYFSKMTDISGVTTQVSSWKTWLSTHNVTVVYPLATTATYHLTGIDQISTLLGTNNIWADCGDITDLEYVADTKLYIQKLTQPTEDDMVANNNIASGTYFMVGNNLYISTASIAVGDAIVPGTNCTATNLAEALNAINS